MSGHHLNPADQQYYNYPTTSSHDPSMDVNTIVDLLNSFGVPVCLTVVLLWFCKYQFDWARKEREAYAIREEEKDAKIISMVEKSSDALLSIKIALEQVKQSVDQNSQVIRELIISKGR
tara:strand:+ start:63 stop:419 length:357 start_codon:yes stop_codon:yes gene_type:complete